MQRAPQLVLENRTYRRRCNVGLAANTLFGLWWLDPAVALAISAACVREGQKAWRGEECGCATCS